MPKEDPFVNRAQLLKAIKKYPEIWDSNNKLHMCRSVTAPLWNEIAEQFGGHVPTVKLQSIWSQMKYHYHNLVHRQILHKERFTTKWEHFEPMSFMYNITVAKIVGAANATNGGGANGDGVDQIAATTQTQTATSSNATITTLSTPPQPPPTILTNSTSLAAATPAPPTSTPHQGRGRPSGTFTSWLPPTAQQIQQQQHQHHIDAQLQQARSIHSTVQEQTQFTGFSGLVPPAVVTIETTTTPPVRKPGRPGSLNNSMRGRIIDAIKAHPVLWTGRQRETQPRAAGQNASQNRTSAVWKEIAAELGLTPSLVQTRWSIIKQRYVDELQKERHSQYTQQGFRSTWEHFERMSFMRDILTKKVDEREQTREHIQEIVSEQQQQQQQQQHQQQQQQQQQQHHQQQQAQEQHHQSQQHQQEQQQQNHLLRYGRPPPLHHHTMMMTGLTGLAGIQTAGGITTTIGHHHSHHLHHHPHHPLVAMCDDMNGGVAGSTVPGINAGIDVSTMLPMHLGGSVGVGISPGIGVGVRRRVKTESDLEWDPFEMILQVHGTEPAAN